MWTYSQETGELRDPSGVHVACGYSGHEEGLNNPVLQNAKNVGPIPEGLWDIGPAVHPQDHLGPLALPLTPQGGLTQTFGRMAFFIHGDTEEDVALCIKGASHGCIIMPYGARSALAASTCKVLSVVRSFQCPT